MGTLLVHYQPQVDMRTGAITGFEALARWHDEEYGDVSPVDFVSVAESSGLVSQLGEFVLRTACAQAAVWRRTRPVRVSINLSPIQLLRPDIVDTFRAVVEENAMDPRLLELEVTETALMRNPEAAVRLLHAFREDGVSVAIDDFGIGYSSLGQLRALPVDRIKIDRTFVRGIGHGDSGAIATAIVTLAKALGIAVIAEGVETLAQKDFLVTHGCVEAQGFLYSRPLSAEHATALLAAGGSLRAQQSRPEGGTTAVVA
jgi:EAL domain-containing protein (putative c-di-GMP-specific phosphodiesterase class I)